MKTGEEMKAIIVDDSIIFRKQILEIFYSIADIEVIQSYWNGKGLVEYLTRDETIIPDLVTLDVEMPEMDGIETMKAISSLRKINPALKKMKVLMVSSITRDGAQATIAALQNGAFDFILKPSNVPDPKKELRILLEEKIKLMREESTSSSEIKKRQKNPDKLRKPEVVAIGVSTGGPAALKKLLPELCEKMDLPVLVVQHMPLEFTESLAQSLDKYTRHNVLVGQHGMKIEKNHVYIAPGGSHMLARKGTNSKSIVINENPPENGCRPSVDPLFRSVAESYEGKSVAVVLTGMGSDGSRSLGTLARAGSVIIAQDQETSVVWGMPGNAVSTGFVDRVLPLEKISEQIMEYINE